MLAVWLGLALGSFFVGGCGRRSGERTEPPAPRGAGTPGPLVARVGELTLTAERVPLLARLARELRRENGLEAPDGTSPEVELGLAVEVLLLAQEAQKREVAPAGAVEAERQSLLVRAYLDRSSRAVAELPIAEGELVKRLAEEKETYQVTGESKVLEPTVIEVEQVSVGLFPDLHVPASGEEPVLSRAEAEALAKRLRGEWAEGRVDLYDFRAWVRRFMVDNPTARLSSDLKIFDDPDLATLTRPLHTALRLLKGVGDLSQPVYHGGAFHLLRRGVTRVGKCERVQDCPEELRALIRRERRKVAYEDQWRSLQIRFETRLWPEHLSAAPPSGNP